MKKYKALNEKVFEICKKHQINIVSYVNRNNVYKCSFVADGNEQIVKEVIEQFKELGLVSENVTTPNMHVFYLNDDNK